MEADEEEEPADELVEERQGHGPSAWLNASGLANSYVVINGPYGAEVLPLRFFAGGQGIAAIATCPGQL